MTILMGEIDGSNEYFEGYLETISEFCREVAGSEIIGLQAKYEFMVCVFEGRQQARWVSMHILTI